MGAMLKAFIAVAVMFAPAVADDPKPPRVLLVTGVDHPAHNWQTTAPAIREVLQQDHQFAVRIVEHPDLLASEMIFDYDVVFLHFSENTHDPRGPFTVQIVDSEHAITRGMSDFETDDELYIGLVGERPVKLLAAARSRLTGKDHPMAFAFTYGNGRVFHTPLGHDEEAIRVPGAAELLRRGCAWVAGRDP